MRFSARSKVGILLSLVTIVTILGAFMVTVVSRGQPSHAAASTASFGSAHFQAQQVSSGTLNSARSKTTRSQAHTKHPSPREVPFYSPYHGKANVSAPARNIPGVAASNAIDPKANEGDLLQNFNGLSDKDTASD